MNADAVSEWAQECAVFANAAGLIELPYMYDDPDVDRLLALYGIGLMPFDAARQMFMRH